MRRAVLDDLLEHKLPALAQAGVDVGQARIVLFSRAGFTPDLQRAAAERGVQLRRLGDVLNPELWSD